MCLLKMCFFYFSEKYDFSMIFSHPPLNESDSGLTFVWAAMTQRCLLATTSARVCVLTLALRNMPSSAL